MPFRSADPTCQDEDKCVKKRLRELAKFWPQSECVNCRRGTERQRTCIPKILKTKTCPHCLIAHEGKSRLCDRCNKESAENFKKAPMPCPNCGKKKSHSADLCKACFNDKRRVCPICGAGKPILHRVCSKCSAQGGKKK